MSPATGTSARNDQRTQQAPSPQHLHAATRKLIPRRRRATRLSGDAVIDRDRKDAGTDVELLLMLFGRVASGSSRQEIADIYAREHDDETQHGQHLRDAPASSLVIAGRATHLSPFA